MRMLTLTLAFLLPAAAEWRSPLLGYLATAEPLELRMISGIPGASILSEPLPLPEGLAGLWLAPGHRYAFADRGDALPPVLLLLDGETAPQAPLGGAMSGARLAAFSPSGAAIALYSAAESRLQVFSGLPGAPALVRDQILDPPAALAVSDDAHTLLVSDAAGEISLLESGGRTRFLFRAREPGALAFLPHRDAALISDLDQIYLLDGAVAPRLLASGLDRPGELRASVDGRSALVASRDGRRVWWIDIATATLQPVDLPAGPAVLEALRLADAFLISAAAGEPAWMLVRNGFESRSYFIPAAAPAEERELQ